MCVMMMCSVLSRGDLDNEIFPKVLYGYLNKTAKNKSTGIPSKILLKRMPVVFSVQLYMSIFLKP